MKTLFQPLLSSMLVAGAFGIAAMACASAGETAPEDQNMKTSLERQAFHDRVIRSGGRADYVFEDQRPFAQCHASTVVEAAGGSLVCAWFGGTREKHPDVGIWMARFAGDRWSPCTLAAKVNQTPHWNPVLFRDPKRGLFLFFKVGPEIPYWQTYWMCTQDNGVTWSAPTELVPGDQGGRGPVKNKPILLSDGAWLAPASTELKRWKPFADRSEDGGKTWQRTADFQIDRQTTHCGGAIQPTFWESAPGTVHALMRTACGCIVRTDSRDGGRTWDPVYRTALPNNNSGIDALRLEDGRVLLVYNPVGRNWGKRTPLTLAVSPDNGATWRNIAHLETEQGEYSYPAIVSTARGIAISYTWKRQRIRCWQIPLDALE